jgi:hypothetical protein
MEITVQGHCRSLSVRACRIRIDTRRCVLPIQRCSHDLASMPLALAYNSIAS